MLGVSNVLGICADVPGLGGRGEDSIMGSVSGEAEKRRGRSAGIVKTKGGEWQKKKTGCREVPR